MLPFLEIDEELWNPELTRLTLLIDPGRIKRGLRPLEEVGPSMQVGHSYTLIIRSEWKDARGVPLKSEARKTFRVTVPDRAPPDPAMWKITPPVAAARNPLVVTFEQPMDHALAMRLIRVRDEQGRDVPGDVELADEETTWRFTPQKAWVEGRNLLTVNTIIEDLAGNSVGRPFEVDLFDRIDRRVTSEKVSLSFEIK